MSSVKIVYQAPSKILYDSIAAGQLEIGAAGGHAYDFLATCALKQRYDLVADQNAVRHDNESMISLSKRLRRNSINADVVIKDAAIIALGKNNPTFHQIGIVHHIDEILASKNLKYWLYFKLLKWRLRQLDQVVCVSNYWKVELEKLGCEKITTIYNSFDLDEFVFDLDEVNSFKRKYRLTSDAPLIYVGNCKGGKGVEEVCQALGDGNYQLIASGPVAKNSGPVRCLSLSRREYLLLLKACDIVMTMSIMPEGWNRVAHEAMLCKTPVIGSGSGGMMELLKGGKQIVTNKFQSLTNDVDFVLSDKKNFEENGYAFVQQFDLKYFSNAWINLVSKVTMDPESRKNRLMSKLI